MAGAAGAGKSAALAWAEVKRSRGGGERGAGWPPRSKAPGLRAGSWRPSPISAGAPALLDGLDDNYRAEIERALAGADLHWSGEGGHQRLFVAVAEMLRLAAADRGAMLVLDDLHEVDEASLRLTHYLARCASAAGLHRQDATVRTTNTLDPRRWPGRPGLSAAASPSSAVTISLSNEDASPSAGTANGGTPSVCSPLTG